MKIEKLMMYEYVMEQLKRFGAKPNFDFFDIAMKRSTGNSSHQVGQATGLHKPKPNISVTGLVPSELKSFSLDSEFDDDPYQFNMFRASEPSNITGLFRDSDSFFDSEIITPKKIPKYLDYIEKPETIFDTPPIRPTNKKRNQY